MSETNKEQVFLDVASNLTRFYTFMSHSLRLVTEEAASEQITFEQVEAQLQKARSALLPRLDRNPVMKEKIENDYQTTVRLTGELKKQGGPSGQHPSSQEALKLSTYAKEKAAALSDLVAIFRSL